ncbi:MAG: hypothetical protein JO165_05455, partial [Candidatus Eremiobacteraeota bacterium]|nr:hypothetical protein [Candidatus Eremiobacteraeota bacterium]
MKCFAVIFSVALLAATPGAARRTITLDDFPAIGVSDAEIAPDASRIAFIVS